MVSICKYFIHFQPSSLIYSFQDPTGTRHIDASHAFILLSRFGAVNFYINRLIFFDASATFPPAPLVASMNSATPAQELAELIATVSSLSKLALDMTRYCIDINGKFLPPLLSNSFLTTSPEAIPRVVDAQVAQALAEATGTRKHGCTPPYVSSLILSVAAIEFVPGVPATPARLELAHPVGVGEFQAWYVVVVGREPGLYRSA